MSTSRSLREKGRFSPHPEAGFGTDLASLVRVLESTPPDQKCFTFLPASWPLTMWARRQASETAAHRFDAENAIGEVSGFDSAFAADALDELWNRGVDSSIRTIGDTELLEVWHANIQIRWGEDAK